MSEPTPPKMTYEKAREYLDRNASGCPHCGNYYVLRDDNEDIFWDGRHASISMQCPTCRQRWTNQYAMVGISCQGQLWPQVKGVWLTVQEGGSSAEVYLLIGSTKGAVNDIRERAAAASYRTIKTFQVGPHLANALALQPEIYTDLEHLIRVVAARDFEYYTPDAGQKDRDDE